MTGMRSAASLPRTRSATRSSRASFPPRMLLRAGNVLKDFRNLCAHDERLYCATVDGASIADMVGYLRVFLPSDEAIHYVHEAANLWQAYAPRMPSLSFSDLFTEMGFRVRQDAMTS